MKFSSHRFRDFVMALDLISAIAIMVFIFGALFSIYTYFSDQYFETRRHDAEKMRILLEDHLAKARENLQLFITLSESKRELVDRRFIGSFSDLYRLDDDLCIERIYISAEKSRLFPGYSFARGKLGRYLDRGRHGSDFSDIMIGLEDERPSIYYGIRTSREHFLARVEISYLTNLLEKMTQFSGIPVLLLARDGFVLTSTTPELGISTLNPQLSDQNRRSLHAGGKDWIPLFSQSLTAGVTLALLIPLHVVNLLRNMLLLSAFFCVAALILITVFKKRLTERFMLSPLSAFTDRIEKLTAVEAMPVPEAENHHFEELALLDKRFREMAYAIFEREDGLRSALFQLQESRSFIMQAVDNSRQLFGWLTPDGILQYANATSLAMIQVRLEDVAGRFLWETPWFSQDPRVVERLRESILRAAAGETVGYELIHLTLHGEAREVDFMLHPIFDAAGNVSMLVAEGWDITERKKSEAERKELQIQLNHAQKMESVGRLAGGVAHDFNNLLQVIMGYSQLIAFGRNRDDAIRPKVEAIQQACQRAARLVRQLLIFGRKANIEKKPLNLNREVEQSHTILARTIPKMIEIEIRAGRDLWEIHADPVQIEQILLNLGTNAADAMPDGGKLLIETENVILDEDYARNHLDAEPGRYVLLAVTDTGHGIDKGIMDKIFDPFFTTKQLGKGTGLGLASVYGIVKSHDGYISCYSEKDQGTTFKVYLPATEAAHLNESPDIEEQLTGGTESILIVDDEEWIRDFVSKILKEHGYGVSMASNGEEAIEIYSGKDTEIDLVILDIGMPGMGGYKCLSEIINFDPCAKVIIASGYLINAQPANLLEAGAAGYIGKPYQVSELLKKVRTVLDGEA